MISISFLRHIPSRLFRYLEFANSSSGTNPFRQLKCETKAKRPWSEITSVNLAPEIIKMPRKTERFRFIRHPKSSFSDLSRE